MASSRRSSLPVLLEGNPGHLLGLGPREVEDAAGEFPSGNGSEVSVPPEGVEAIPIVPQEFSGL